MHTSDKWVKKDKTLICYCRVSSVKQKDDLQRQVQFMEEKYPGAEVIKDVGSGINFKRHGLRSILERAMRGEQLQVVVAYKNRLARFGAELIEWVLSANSGELLVLDNVSLSPEQELNQDLLTILHIFFCRMHGFRKYRGELPPILKDRGFWKTEAQVYQTKLVEISATIDR